VLPRPLPCVRDSVAFLPEDLVFTAAHRQPTVLESASYNKTNKVALLFSLIQQIPMDSALPNETLVVALSLTAARVLIHAAGYYLLSRNDPSIRSLLLGQLLISIFLCCATAVAVSLAYGRFKYAYTREAVSFIFVSLIGAEVRPTGGCHCLLLTPRQSHRRAMQDKSRNYEALLISAYFLRMIPLL
jgi:hypothetical protein